MLAVELKFIVAAFQLKFYRCGLLSLIMGRKSKLLIFFCIAIPGLLLWITFYHPKVDVTDNFENDKLNKIWSTQRLISSSLEFQSGIVRNGNKALKMTLQTGDVVEEKTKQDNSSERDELLEAISLYSIEEKTYEYQFSLFLPGSFPILPTRLVLAQWKQFCPFCSCSEYSPIVAIRYISGKLFITLQTNSARDTLYQLNDEMRNRWLDFRFQIKFSKSKEGRINAFLNGRKIINYTGITSYENNCRILSDKNKYFFKMGLYRDRIKQPMSIYIDNYKKREIE